MTIKSTNAATAELKDLTIEEGSPVDDGDNPPAKIAMMKGKGDDGTTTVEPGSDEEATKAARDGFWTRLKKWAGVSISKDGYGPPRTVGQIVAMDEFRDKFWKLRMAFVDSMNSILQGSADTEQMNGMMAQSVKEFSDMCTAMAKPLGATKARELAAIIGDMSTATVAGGTSKRRDFVGAMQRLEDFDFSPGADAPTPADETNNADKENTMSNKTEKTTAGVEAIMAKLSPDERKVMEDAIKAAPVPAPAKVEEDPALKGASPELLKRMQNMEAELAAMKDKDTDGTFTAKARALDVPGADVADVAKQLRNANTAGGSAAVELLEKTLRALSAQARKGNLLMEKMGIAGKRTETTGGPSTADELVKQKAEELRKSNPKLTAEQAYARVIADPANSRLAAAAMSGMEIARQ